MPLYPSMPGPGLYPTLLEKELDKLFDRAQIHASQQRKALALAKLEILQGDFEAQVQEEIYNRWQNPTIRERMTRFISLTFNAGQDITNAVAVAYNYGTRRFLKDASDELEEVWSKALREGNLDGDAIALLQLAFIQGQPSLAVPRVRHGALTRDVNSADSYDVITDPTDPTGPLAGVVWEIKDGSNIDQANEKRVRWVILDRENWYYYNRHGVAVEGPEGLEFVQHFCEDQYGEPATPAIPFRLELPIGDDPYWGAVSNNRLWKGTVEIAVAWTRLQYLRKSQDSKLVNYFAPAGMELPPGQILNDPEGGVKVIGDGAGGVQFNVNDLDLSPQHYLMQIAAGYAALVESYGIPASAVTFDWSGGQGGGMESVQPTVSIQVTKEKLNLLRNKQIRFLLPAERYLHTLSASVMRGQRHRNWSQIPPPDEVWDSTVTEFGEIDTIADPKQRREQDQWEREQGLKSRIDLVQRKFPEMTRREALEFIKRNVDEDSEINEILAERNQPLGGPAAPTTAELNGAQGPMVRDAPDGAPDASDEA